MAVRIYFYRNINNSAHVSQKIFVLPNCIIFFNYKNYTYRVIIYILRLVPIYWLIVALNWLNQPKCMCPNHNFYCINIMVVRLIFFFSRKADQRPINVSMRSYKLCICGMCVPTWLVRNDIDRDLSEGYVGV